MNTIAYDNFLSSKIKTASRCGISVKEDRLHASTKPHQRDIILWALELGRALVAADTGTVHRWMWWLVGS